MNGRIIAERMRRLLGADVGIYDRFEALAARTPFNRPRIEDLLFQAEWEAGIVSPQEMWQHLEARLAAGRTDLSLRRNGHRFTLDEDRQQRLWLKVWEGPVPVARLVMAVRDHGIWKEIAAEGDFLNLIRKVEGTLGDSVAAALKSQQRDFMAPFTHNPGGPAI